MSYDFTRRIIIIVVIFLMIIVVVVLRAARVEKKREIAIELFDASQERLRRAQGFDVEGLNGISIARMFVDLFMDATATDNETDR